jgi:hypothetical protein
VGRKAGRGVYDYPEQKSAQEKQPVAKAGD